MIDEPCEDCLNEEPDMIDPRWAWLAVPFWWTVLLFYAIRDFFRRKK